MEAVFLIATPVSLLMVTYSALWHIFSRKRNTVRPPFVSVLWVAFLVIAGFWIMYREGSVVLSLIIASLSVIASWIAYREWQAWLSLDTAEPGETSSE